MDTAPGRSRSAQNAGRAFVSVPHGRAPLRDTVAE